MARKTREDTEQTRQSIIAAARAVFTRQGVRSTTLEQVASEAGVTRGAIYHHFDNKMALFQAMREQVQLPMMDASVAQLLDATLDPLARVRHLLLATLESVQGHEVTRATLEIMTFKCEYVGDFAANLDQARHCHDEMFAQLCTTYRAARRSGQLRAGLSAETAAAQTVVFIGGLIKTWLFDEAGTLVRNRAPKLIDAHVDGQRALAAG